MLVQRLFEPPEVHHERLFVVSVLGFFVNVIGIFAFQHGGSHHGHSHGTSGHGHSHTNAGHGHSHADTSHHHGHSHSHSHGHSHSAHSRGGHAHSHTGNSHSVLFIAGFCRPFFRNVDNSHFLFLITCAKEVI